ncbi:NAD-dependent histone deacetylase SIR2 [Purpureocillium lavendulum]|uniref:NAD-dependent histone deacetylase SIR2 n=1 Tax=Purpureocillium lavendulum TaxID=1247861 RepID=A0AB34G3N7_9HYPO|nr:NAD-dependent histone deacetylase SIR2 [Purpureocillium lavendulum]
MSADTTMAATATNLSSPLSSAPASDPVSSPSSPLSSLPSTPSVPGSPLLHQPSRQQNKRPDPSSRYPSPTSSAPSGTQSPVKLGEPMDDSPRPTKRRRIAAPKDRTTMYLDLMKPNDDFTHEDNFHLQRLLAALHKKKKIVVIAGAGISVSAGIPDFRSSTGLFATARSQHKLKASGKHLFDASVYKHDSSTQSFHTMVREMAGMVQDATPTPFHHLLASLAKEGRLLRLYSQNIDCIDTSMPPLHTSVPLEPKGPWPKTVQLHGGLEKMVCTKCGDLKPFNGDLFNGPEAPLCGMCKEHDEVRTTHAGKRSHGIGRLRPRFVLYNEFNPDEEAIGNVARADLKARPDAVIVVGTTLKVPGTRRLVKEMCQVARGRKDGFTAWVNIDPEPKGVEFKDCWDLVVRSKCDDVARLASLPPYDCEIGDNFEMSQEQYDEKMGFLRKNSIEVGIPSSPTKTTMEVHLEAKPKQIEDMQAIPTPRPSPPVSASKGPAKAKQTKIVLGKPAVGKPVPKKEPGTKISKPRARKPKQAAKDKAPPKNTLMQKLKTSKATVVDASKKATPNDSLPSRVAPQAFIQASPRDVVVKDEAEKGFALPSLRPELSQRRSSSDSYFTCESAVTSSAAPSTPTTAPEPIPQDTVSPKTVPQNMGHLLHLESPRGL